MDRFTGIFIKRTPSDERFHVERCSSRNMELLKIKIADGSEDPVNVVFEGVELSEVKAVLKREEWEEPVFSNAALLEGRGPDLEMQRAVLDEVVRFHIRLFRYGGRVVGNVHLDRVPIERLEGVVRVLMGRPHESDHTVGVDYLSGVFVRHGYSVVVETGPYVIAKIFKVVTQ
jgi:hypothetical protein